MKFLWTTLHVSDMEASLAFYQEIVGLEIERKIEFSHSRCIYFLGNDQTKLELIYDSNDTNIDMGQSVSIGFLVDNLDDTISFLSKNNIGIINGPMQPNPHIRFLHVKDPDGLKVQFVEEM